MAFVDVDGLKAINAPQGHAAGDRMLRQVVQTLRARLRSYDLILRYGGDEFICALPGMAPQDASSRIAWSTRPWRRSRNPARPRLA